MIARRLMAATGKRDGFATLAPVVTAATDGGWTVVPFPKAFVYNGKAYIGSAVGNTGALASDIVVGTYNLSSLASSLFTLRSAPTVDTHNAPAIIVRETDKRIVAAYCEQNDTNVVVRISTNPEDATAFGDEIVATTGGTHTYVAMAQLNGVSGRPIYLFYTKGITQLACVVSTDGGATWGAETILVQNPENVYWRIGTDWNTRIDIFVTDAAPTVSNLYHFYIDGTDGSSHNTNGTTIASFPFAASTLAQVLSNALGPCWSFGASWDGLPATVIMQGVSPTDNAVKVARLRSGSWQVDTVVGSVGGQFAGDKYFSGCAIDPADPNVVYVAEKIGSVFEIVRHLSDDDGATWDTSPLTGGSSQDNVMPDVPVGAAPGLREINLRGTLTSSAVYDFEVRGIR